MKYTLTITTALMAMVGAAPQYTQGMEGLLGGLMGQQPQQQQPFQATTAFQKPAFGAPYTQQRRMQQQRLATQPPFPSQQRFAPQSPSLQQRQPPIHHRLPAQQAPAQQSFAPRPTAPQQMWPQQQPASQQRWTPQQPASQQRYASQQSAPRQLAPQQRAATQPSRQIFSDEQQRVFQDSFANNRRTAPKSRAPERATRIQEDQEDEDEDDDDVSEYATTKTTRSQPKRKIAGYEKPRKQSTRSRQPAMDEEEEYEKPAPQKGMFANFYNFAKESILPDSVKNYLGLAEDMIDHSKDKLNELKKDLTADPRGAMGKIVEASTNILGGDDDEEEEEDNAELNAILYGNATASAIPAANATLASVKANLTSAVNELTKNITLSEKTSVTGNSSNATTNVTTAAVNMTAPVNVTTVTVTEVTQSDSSDSEVQEEVKDKDFLSDIFAPQLISLLPAEKENIEKLAGQSSAKVHKIFSQYLQKSFTAWNAAQTLQSELPARQTDLLIMAKEAEDEDSKEYTDAQKADQAKRVADLQKEAAKLQPLIVKNQDVYKKTSKALSADLISVCTRNFSVMTPWFGLLFKAGKAMVATAFAD